MNVNALIIDDEPLAQNVIEQYAKKLPNLVIAGKCNDAICAHAWLQENQADLIFLDINMPKLSGISFLKSLKNAPMVILTTAYSEYALEGFELDVTDYLIKPFSFERFCKAFFKAEQLLHLKQSAQKGAGIAQEEKEFIFIKSNKKTYKINLSEICHIEGLGDYIQIHLTDQKIVTNLSMKKIMEVLPAKGFYRIHKSFIISLDKLELLEGNTVIVNKKRLPVGNNYRQEFLDFMNLNMSSD
jgi:DNA-binding LytR/AlgR family response regulator